MRARTSLFVLLMAGTTSLFAQKPVYPNPAGDMVKIEAPDSSVVTIVNATGGEVRRGVTAKGYIELDTKELGEGLYFVNVVTANRPTTTRLIVEHK